MQEPLIESKEDLIDYLRDTRAEYVKAYEEAMEEEYGYNDEVMTGSIRAIDRVLRVLGVSADDSAE